MVVTAPRRLVFLVPDFLRLHFGGHAALSQLHGRVLHVAHADHLDDVGHYTLAGKTADRLPSGAGFTPEGFEATWGAVAAAIARSGRAARGERQR